MRAVSSVQTTLVRPDLVGLGGLLYLPVAILRVAASLTRGPSGRSQRHDRSSVFHL